MNTNGHKRPGIGAPPGGGTKRLSHPPGGSLGDSNGRLPDYLLYPDEAGKWHLTDRFGRIAIAGNLNLSHDTLVSLLKEAGASYKEITFETPEPAEAAR